MNMENALHCKFELMKIDIHFGNMKQIMKIST